MIRRSKESTNDKDIVLTNGFVPADQSEVRFVIGLGVPCMGITGVSSLMDQWLRFLEETADLLRSS